MPSRKILVITVLNCFLVAYMGWLIWSLKYPSKRVSPVASQHSHGLQNKSTQELVELALGAPTHQGQIQAIRALPVAITPEEFSKLLQRVQITPQAASFIEGIDWMRELSGVAYKNEEHRLNFIRQMISGLKETQSPLVFRNQCLYLFFVGMIEEFNPLSDRATAEEIEKRKKRQEILLPWVSEVMAVASQETGLLPLVIQGKSALIQRFPDRFPQEEWKKDILESLGFSYRSVLSGYQKTEITEEILFAGMTASLELKMRESLPVFGRVIKSSPYREGRLLAVKAFSILGGETELKLLQSIQGRGVDEQERIYRAIYEIEKRLKSAPRAP